MFNRRNTFFFKNAEIRIVEKHIEKDISLTAQIHVAGSQAKEFLQNFFELNENEINFYENKENIYTFIWHLQDKVKLNTKVDFSAQVDYQEKRKRKTFKPSINFMDESKKVTQTPQFKLKQTFDYGLLDLQAKMPTWIIFATKDNAELNKLCRDYEPHTLGNKGVEYFLPIFLDDFYNLLNMYAPANQKFEFQPYRSEFMRWRTIAEQFNKKFLKSYNVALQNLKITAEKELTKEIKLGIKKEMHEKADEYFNESKGCCCFGR